MHLALLSFWKCILELVFKAVRKVNFSTQNVAYLEKERRGIKYLFNSTIKFWKILYVPPPLLSPERVSRASRGMRAQVKEPFI